MEKTIEVKIIPVKHQFVIGIVTLCGTILVNRLVAGGYNHIMDNTNEDDED